MNDIELALILGFYCFDKVNNLGDFSKRFNQYFQKNLSPQTILFEVSKFKGIDPSNNVDSNEDNKYYRLVWERYITSDKKKELKELYNCFKKGVFMHALDIEDDDSAYVGNFRLISTPEVKDTPQLRPSDYHSKGVKAYVRSGEVVANALALAGHSCEGKCGVLLFLRKDGKTNYTEAHHLIPLCYQNDFEYSLDVEANVVSLCPACHRKLHYGANIEPLLKELLDQRSDRLTACRIGVSYEKLLLLYR